MPLSRRRLLASAGLGAAGVGLGAGGYLVGHEAASADAAGTDGTVPFYGEHQAGIATPVQDRLHFAAFDLETESKAELRELMEAWSQAARRNDRRPDDRHRERQRLRAARRHRRGAGPLGREPDDHLRLRTRHLRPPRRSGSRAQRPAELKPLPALPGDELNGLESDGDICVQACADDPQIVFHAIRNLARIGRGTVTMRWSQLGFGRTSTTSRGQETPRNLFGMKDGTANIKAEDGKAMDEFVWVDDGPAWIRGGSYLVTRRIRMNLEAWDRSSLGDQEETIGRQKYNGAPLGGSEEFEPLPLDDKDSERRTGDPGELPRAARLGAGKRRRCRSSAAATPSPTASTRASATSKRGSSSSPSSATRRREFVALQRKLGVNDALNEYIKHVGSAVFAVPRGRRKGRLRRRVAARLTCTPEP